MRSYLEKIPQNNWPIERLKRAAAIKHGIHTEIIQIARQFLCVVEFKDTPKMLIALDRKKLEKFFLDEARKLKSQILNP